MWITVKGDGSIPEEIWGLGCGEWEYIHRGFPWRTVLAVDHARHCDPMFIHDGLDSEYDVIAVRARGHVKFKNLTKIENIIRECLSQGIAKDLKGNVLVPTAPTIAQVRKSDSMLAYHRFRCSPRGKEALAMIGKREKPTPPIGEAQMVEIFNRALDEFEAEIERKKCSPLS